MKKSRRRAHDQVKIKNQSRNQSYKDDGVEIRRNSFFSDSAYDFRFRRVRSSKNRLDGEGSRSGFVIGLVLSL